MSRPCDECILIMRMYKIKRVMYSTGDLSVPFITESVDEMCLRGSSRGNR